MYQDTANSNMQKAKSEPFFVILSSTENPVNSLERSELTILLSTIYYLLSPAKNSPEVKSWLA